MSIIVGIRALQAACEQGAGRVVPKITLTFPGPYERDEFKRRLAHDVSLNGNGGGALRPLGNELAIAGHPVLLRIEA